MSSNDTIGGEKGKSDTSSTVEPTKTLSLSPSSTSSNANQKESSKSNSAKASSSSSSWWSSLVETAKGKSSVALEIMQKDLSEFTSVMTNDTNELLAKAPSVSVPKPVQSLMSGLSYVLTDGQDDESNKIVSNEDENSNKKEDQKSKKKGNENTISNVRERFRCDLKELESNQETYLIESSDESVLLDQFNKNQDKYKSEISSLMIEKDSIRLVYSQLVPAQISNETFWSRYFFRVSQLEKENEKRIKLLERTSASEKKQDEEDTLNWDDDEEEENNEIKEDDQTEKSKNDESASKETKFKKEKSKNKEEDEKEKKSTEKNKNKDDKVEIVERSDEKSLNEETNLKETEIKELSVEEKSQKVADDDWEKVSDSNLNENSNETIEPSTDDNEKTNAKATTKTEKGEKKGEEETEKTRKNSNVTKRDDENEWDDWGE